MMKNILFCLVLFFVFAGATYRLDWYQGNTRTVKGKCVFTSEQKADEEAEVARTNFPEYRVVVVKCP